MRRIKTKQLSAPVFLQFFKQNRILYALQRPNDILLLIQEVIVLFVEKKYGMPDAMDFKDFIEAFVKGAKEQQLTFLKLIMEIILLIRSIRFHGNVGQC